MAAARPKWSASIADPNAYVNSIGASGHSPTEDTQPRSAWSVQDEEVSG